MFALVLLSLLVSSVTALAVLPRQSGPSTFTTLPYNFTLAAVNTTLPNANTTGVPLVLGQAGAVDGAEFEVTSTYASYPYDDWPSLALVSSSIRAFSSDGSWYTNATDLYSTPYDGTGKAANAPLPWLTTNYYPPAISSTEYSAIQNEGDQFANLAALGRADLWSLCPFWPNDPLSQTNLVFNVTGEADPNTVGFTASECWPVTVNIVPIA